MPNNPITWNTVDATAAALGASEAARLKWRQRETGVPPIWRIRIAEQLRADGVHVDLSAFNELPTKPGRIAA